MFEVFEVFGGVESCTHMFWGFGVFEVVGEGARVIQVESLARLDCAAPHHCGAWHPIVRCSQTIKVYRTALSKINPGGKEELGAIWRQQACYPWGIVHNTESQFRFLFG